VVSVDATASVGDVASPGGVDAVTFDFYNTLVRHPPGGGRGASVIAYLHHCGLASDAWEHQVLYDVFEPHGREYSPTLSPIDRERYFIRLTERLFQRLNVRCDSAAAPAHAAAIWERIGPRSLVVFPEVAETLARLRAAGYRLAVISNWQCGLGHFCFDLGLSDFFDEIVASAEVGYDKPSAEIFLETCTRLGVAPHRVLHIGDTPLDDVEGAARAGIRAVLVCRSAAPEGFEGERICSLAEITRLLGVAG
jgi:HAD superfamily hydrolase (TIGR01509 family)